MSPAIEKPNYTQIPNVILDNIFSFTHTEFKIVVFVCRHTFGWHREEHRMSFTFIEAGCGLSHDTVNNCLITLMAKGVFLREPSGNSFSYSLNIEKISPKFVPVQNSDQSEIRTIDSTANRPILPESVRISDTKKERGIKKEKETTEVHDARAKLIEALSTKERRYQPMTKQAALDLKLLKERMNNGETGESLHKTLVAAQKTDGYWCNKISTISILMEKLEQIRNEINTVKKKPKQFEDENYSITDSYSEGVKRFSVIDS